MPLRALASVLLLALPGPTGGPEAARAAFVDGLAAVREGRIERGRELLAAAASDAPTWELPRIELARIALARKERLGEARAELEAVARFGPENPRLHRVLGDLAMALHDEAAAAGAWGRALDLAFDPEVSASRAAALAGLERHEEAAAECARYLQRRPDEHFMRARRAAELEAAGLQDGARAELETLARLQPAAVTALRQLARFLDRNGTIEEASAAHAAADRAAGHERPGRRLRALPPSRR